MLVRDATEADLPAIVEIYNHVIATSDAIWMDDPVTLDDRLEWFRAQRPEDAVLVAVDDHDRVLGYASFGPFRSKPGYWPTIELTIHLGEHHRGQGIGQVLLDALLDRARAAGRQVAVAGIDGGNTGSIRFHERNGFRVVATMPGIGRKDGRVLDLVLMQRSLSSADPEEPC